MTGVVFIFVREDASDVEALAEAFDQAGYAIAGSDGADDVLNIVVWSRAAARSEAFRAAADRVLNSSRTIVASLIAPPHPELVHGARVANISAWDGVNDDGLAPLFDAVLDIVHPVRVNVIALPGPVIDAEFTEAPLQLAHAVAEPISRARAAWEAPIPAKVLRPVPDDAAAEPRQLKAGAPSPRRDFRRIRRHQHHRAHAALAFALVALIGGAAVAFNAPSPAPAPRAHVEITQQAEAGGVSLTSAAEEAIGLEDAAPQEQARLFEPRVQVGRAGIEPPSARSVRRAAYSPRQQRDSDLIPAASDAQGRGGPM